MDRIPKAIYDDKGVLWELFKYQPDSKSKHTLVYHSGYNDIVMVMKPSSVERHFTRKGRPDPVSKVIVQGRYECAAAALAMLLGESLFATRQAMGKAGWSNDDRGAKEQMEIDAARYLGRDIIKLRKEEIGYGIGPCIVGVNSLNIKGMGHAVTWTGSEILDPNWGRQGRLFWGTEWAPWTMGATSAMLLLPFNLSEQERALHDKLMRKRETGILDKIRPPSFKEAVGMK